MANEGDFNKIDGDVLYASEIRKLHGLGSVTTVGTTVEGTFPKVDGDILFASEVNMFNSGTIPNFASGISTVTFSGLTGSFSAGSTYKLFDEDFSTGPGSVWKTGGASNVQASGVIFIDLNNIWPKHSIRAVWTVVSDDGQAGNGITIKVSDDNINYYTVGSSWDDTGSKFYDIQQIPMEQWKFRYMALVVGTKSSVGTPSYTALDAVEVIVT